MRLARAVERYLQWRQLELDATPRSLDSYWRTLAKLIDDHPEAHLHDFEGRDGKQKVRDTIAKRWATAAGRTRANRISVFHSFFAWAEAEGFIDDDRVREIKRPPARRADVYRPPAEDRAAAYRHVPLDDRPAWLLMEKVGLRAATVCALRWRDLNLLHGTAHIHGKGGHRDALPIAPDALHQLRELHQALAPDPDDHVYTVARELWEGPGRVRRRRDPKQPVGTASLWRMVRRACDQAKVRPFGPHALRHAFATSFLRDSDRDAVSLQKLMRHSSISTTMGYVDELSLDELRVVLDEVAAKRAQALPVVETEEAVEITVASTAEVRPAGFEPASDTARDSEPVGSEPGDPRRPDVTDPEGGHKE